MFNYAGPIDINNDRHNRMYRPVLVTGPAETPVTNEEAMLHLRVDNPDAEDPLVDGLIDGATAYLDAWQGRLGGRCLVTQTWLQHYDCFARRLRLPLDPVQSISSVTYLDANNATQTVSSSNYQLLTDALGPFVCFNSTYTFPTSLYTEPPLVAVTYVAGYGDADEVPAAIKQAMLLLIANWYKNREAVLDGYRVELLPGGVEALLAPFTRAKF